VFDVTDAPDFQAFAEVAVERFYRIDALVNKAGMMPLSPLAAVKQDEWNRMIDVSEIIVWPPPPWALSKQMHSAVTSVR